MEFKPMLAVNTTVDSIKLPVYGSIKLEGVRGVFTPQGLFARSLKKLGNPGLAIKFKVLDKYCRQQQVYLEGEFYKHGMDFSDISSICRRGFHDNTDSVKFYIFDYYNEHNPNSPFSERTKKAREVTSYINAIGNHDVECIQQIRHIDHAEIRERYSAAVEEGYEGYVLKSPHGTYKHGRTTHNEQKFLRMKPENTYDGMVFEITERMENLCSSETNELGYLSKSQDKDKKRRTGMAACAIVRCPEFADPIRVTLSRGLTDKDRADIWENRDQHIGRHLRFVGIPVKGMLPRAPRFDAWRTDLD